MENYKWSLKKENDKWGILVVLFLLTIFFIGKAIIESGHLLFYIICLVLGIIAYFLIGKFEKYKQCKPASLGKMYEKKYPIIVQYTPPKGINPAEAGLLYNCSVEPTDLTSLIYQWKFEKLIDIKTFKGENSKKEYVKLIKLEEIPITRPLFETEIFDSIFRMGGVKIIEGAFQLRYALMLEDLEYHGIQKGWLTYRENKQKRRKQIKSNGYDSGVEMIFFGIYLFLAVFSSILEVFGVSTEIPESSISFSSLVRSLIVVLCVVLLVILICGKMDGRSNLKFTDKGADLASKIIGYSQFIKSCDENKIKLLLKEDPLFIDRTLPYATAFGMETEFLNKISPLKKDWNAKYVRGTKIPAWAGVLSFFMRDDDTLL